MARRSSHADPAAYRGTVSQRRLPAEIYWRRRLLLLAVVIAIVWGVLQLTGGGGGEGDDATASGTPTARVTAPTPSPAAVPEQTVDGPVDVAVVGAETACDPEKVRITPSVRPDQLTKGPVDVNLTISSTQAGACTLEPDDAEAIAVISANGTPVWDSTVCKSSLLDSAVQLSPQWATLATVQWTGRGSGSNCTSNQGWASAGTYTLQIGTLGGEPGKTSFSLAARPAPAKTSPPPEAPASPAAPAAPATPATPPAPSPGTPENPSGDPPVTPAEG
jgi:hypothetical protein